MSPTAELAIVRGPRTLRRRSPGVEPRPRRARGWSMAPLLAAEMCSALVGFGVMLRLARALGPSGFADFEYASAVTAWCLVVVRGGFDTIAYREAARRPALIRPLTDLLLGLRLASAAVGLLGVVGLASLAEPGRGPVVILAGLVLIPSALAADLGLRAEGRFVPLALAQAVRALGLALGVGFLISSPGRAIVAAGCVAGAEVASTLVLLGFHAADHGIPRPRIRRRAWSVLASRGAVAGLTRFGRVTLYAADMIALGWVAGSGLGPYAAARRLAFALLALGLVVPSALGPRLATAWAAGPAEARAVLGRASLGLATATWPATVGLLATADRWMPRLFGTEFRDGGPWLALIAARLPLILASNLQQTALVAARRERSGLRLMAMMVGLALILIPPLTIVGGPWGVGLGMLGVEAAGVLAGRRLLRGLELLTAPHPGTLAIAGGSIGVALVCWVGGAWPLEVVVPASVLVYAATWALGSSRHLARTGREVAA